MQNPPRPFASVPIQNQTHRKHSPGYESIRGSDRAHCIYTVPKLKLKSCNRQGETMSTVLQLQKLVPAVGPGEVSMVFVSTYSSICPTNSPQDGGQFEME